MAMKTLLEYATDRRLTSLLVKERAKCSRRNRSDRHHTLDRNDDFSDLAPRKMLSRMMPPRSSWLRPQKKKRIVKVNGASDIRKNAEKSLMLTINHDRVLQLKGVKIPYLDELDAFIARIRNRLAAPDLKFESPRLMPILKDKKEKDDKTLLVTCRPLSTYHCLEDKIILSLTGRYLTHNFDKYLHENILSYRPPRAFHGNPSYLTDFNDGIKLIKEFRCTHVLEPIYAADCDIKKFFDIIPHIVVLDCFKRLLDQSPLSAEGKAQVMKVLQAYLNSFNFFTNALQEAENDDNVYSKVRRRLHDSEKKNTYQLKWVDEVASLPDEKKLHIGLPQGGALSPLIANIVLNDVDKAFLTQDDPNCLFIRFCDDIILLHTDYEECCRLIQQYAKSLSDHGLYYHDFEPVGDRKQFWEIKSHLPFLWDDGDDNANRYIGFLGYEMRRDGRIRLRKSNIMRFRDKFERQKYALKRYSKKHNPEDTQNHKKQVLNKILRGIDFYEGLDLKRFKGGSQYKYLEKLSGLPQPEGSMY